MWKRRLPLKIKVFAWLLLRRQLDDEIPSAAYGTGRSSGMPAVRQGSGGLPTLILQLPLSPNSVAGDRRRPPRGDLGGGHSGGLSAAEHFVAKSSGRQFLPHSGPSRSVGTRVAPHPLMLFCTTRGGLRLFGNEVV